MTAIGVVSLAAWLWLLCARGRFWWPRFLPKCEANLSGSVVAVIPARDEAAAIGASVESIGARVIVVDDHSSDATAALARQAGADVVTSPPLPSGWTGKLWAVHQGVEAAAWLAPNYYLLTDADVVHAPDSVERLLGYAQAGDYDLVSLMVKLHCRTLAEKFLIPAFVFFFFLLYPPRWVSEPKRRTAAAAGGCMLIRRTALERIGGIAAIKGELIDDCALARRVKDSGGRIWLGVTETTHSMREYQTFAEIERMISRTAFTQLQHSPWLLAATSLGLLLVYIAPPVLALSGNPFGMAAWILMSVLFVPTVRLYRLSPLWALLLPATALFYLGATLHSAVQYWRGRGGEWKGRVQDPL
ncbi:MAG: glycosyltransferase [Acidobacteriota bacterium]|nr:glycosyltransferase [Acidobacteriota bacterium]